MSRRLHEEGKGKRSRSRSRKKGRSRSRSSLAAKNKKTPRNNFADGPQGVNKDIVSKPLGGARPVNSYSSENKLKESVDLKLGCFELPEARKKKESKGCESIPHHSDTSSIDHGSNSQSIGESSKKDDQMNARKEPEKKSKEVDLVGLREHLDGKLAGLRDRLEGAAEAANKTAQINESLERREREYFKASFGDPCGPGNRFLVEGELGRGSFSTVFKCRDTKGQCKDFAIKFIRANAMLQKATEQEIKLMRRLRTQASEKDPEGANCLLALAGVETFEHEGHLALVFHLQRSDAKSWLQKSGAFSLTALRGYAQHLFLGLRALRAIRVIHTDLKPDNLLLSLDLASIKISDFGNAIELEMPQRPSFIRPAYCTSYRAPEVILGQSYSTRVDMWSAGVTLFELATGRALLTGEVNNSFIHGMLKVCGAFPKRFAISGKCAGKHFDESGNFICKNLAGKGDEKIVPMCQFPKPAHLFEDSLRERIAKTLSYDSSKHLPLLTYLAKLLALCIVPDPAGRGAPESALQQRFCSYSPKDLGGTERHDAGLTKVSTAGAVTEDVVVLD